MGLAMELPLEKVKAAAKALGRSRRNPQAGAQHCRRFDRCTRSRLGSRCYRTWSRHYHTGWSRSTRIHCRSHFYHSCPTIVFFCSAVFMFWGTCPPATRGRRGAAVRAASSSGFQMVWLARVDWLEEATTILGCAIGDSEEGTQGNGVWVGRWCLTGGMGKSKSRRAHTSFGPHSMV